MTEEGSYVPSIVLVLLAVVLWVMKGESVRARSIRKKISMMKLSMKKRDKEKYKSGVGDGANIRNKRVG